MVDRELKELIDKTVIELNSKSTKAVSSKAESEFLNSLRERLLIFFEALQSKELINQEEKLEITINYLEYMLSIIEDRLKELIKN